MNTQHAMFLSEAELVALTGYRRPSKQRALLRKWGVEPFVNRRGKLQVTRDIIEHAQRELSGYKNTLDSTRKTRPRLDLAK